MYLLSTATLVLLSLQNVAAGTIPEMETRQTNAKCSISGTSAAVNCRQGPTRSYPSVTSFLPGESFAVQCMVDGEGIDGEKAWGYLPAWDCWVAVRWTDLGCKRKLFVC
ncbi:hypothetical protein V8F06_007533 [Rhypophila decipiens]